MMPNSAFRYSTKPIDILDDLRIQLVQGEQKGFVRLSKSGYQLGKLQFFCATPFVSDQAAILNALHCDRVLSIETVVYSVSPKRQFYFMTLSVAADDLFQAKIFLQLSAIANFKRLSDSAGRKFSMDQAAKEWIAEFASDFSLEFEKRLNLPPNH